MEEDVQLPGADMGRWWWNHSFCLARREQGVTVFAPSAPHPHGHRCWGFSQGGPPQLSGMWPQGPGPCQPPPQDFRPCRTDLRSSPAPGSESLVGEGSVKSIFFTEEKRKPHLTSAAIS